MLATSKTKGKHAMKIPELQQRMMDELGLSERDFGGHATDLYVVAKPGVHEWLKENHKFPENITSFIGQKGSDWNGAGVQCFDIPFAGNWPSKD